MATLKESLSKGITAINVKTNTFKEESKLRTYISTLEREIQTLKMNIGEMVYAKSLIGESYEEGVAELVKQIQGKYAEIENQKAAIEQLAIEQRQILGTSETAAIKFCLKCGSQNSGAYKFCAKCGNPL